MKPVVLFVDDNENILQGLRRSLRSVHREWDLRFALNGAEALKIMDAERIDVIVTDIRMPVMEGVALLAEAYARHEHAIRFVLSGQSEDKDVAPLLAVSHQYLAKPMDTEVIIKAIKPALAARDRLHDPDLKEFITGLSGLPSLPELYDGMTSALRQTPPSIDKIETLLLRDISLVAKIFQMLNSSYFGSNGDVNSVSRIWESLGIGRVKMLLLDSDIAVEPDKSLADSPFIATLWHMSLTTARIARLIAKADNLPQKTCDKAWVAGLLHAIGAVVLYEYRRQKTGDVECGDLLDSQKNADSYIDAGAFLSILWGLPQDIQYVIRGHAAPSKIEGEGDKLMLAIVHAARAFALARNNPETAEESYLDRPFLNAAGIGAGRMESWKAAAETIQT